MKTMRAIAAVASVLILQFDVAHEAAMRRAQAQNATPVQGTHEDIQARPWENRPWETRPSERPPWEARPWEARPGEARPRELRQRNTGAEQRRAGKKLPKEPLGQESQKTRESVDKDAEQFNRSGKWQRHHKDSQRFNPGGLIE
jgi:hypothetical protein